MEKEIVLAKVVDLCSPTLEGGPSLLQRMMDSIEDYTRKVELKEAFREMLEFYTFYKDDEQKLIKKYIKKHCDTVNLVRDKKKEKILNPEQVSKVPDYLFPDFRKEINILVNKKIVLKNPPLFTKKEEQGSRINISEMMRVETFIINLKVSEVEGNKK